MERYSYRHFVVAVVLISVGALLPSTASAAGPCAAMTPASTPSARADLFHKALDRFTAAHATLTAEQRQFLSQSVKLGDALAAPEQDARAQASLVRKAKQFVDRSHELFTINQLGELFTSMGSVQLMFADMVAATPFCNCSGTGGCTFEGGPSGTCAAGCVSWDAPDGRQDGICSAAAAQ